MTRERTRCMLEENVEIQVKSPMEGKTLLVFSLETPPRTQSSNSQGNTSSWILTST